MLYSRSFSVQPTDNRPIIDRQSHLESRNKKLDWEYSRMTSISASFLSPHLWQFGGINTATKPCIASLSLPAIYFPSFRLPLSLHSKGKSTLHLWERGICHSLSLISFTWLFGVLIDACQSCFFLCFLIPFCKRPWRLSPKSLASECLSLRLPSRGESLVHWTYLSLNWCAPCFSSTCFPRFFVYSFPFTRSLSSAVEGT